MKTPDNSKAPDLEGAILEVDRSTHAAAVLAWLVFGLGHLYLGRRWKAGVLFVLLSAAFIMGLELNAVLFLPQETELHSFWIGLLGFVGYLGSGLYFAMALVLYPIAGKVSSASYEAGWTFALCASLLNYLAVVDAWDIARGKKG